MADLLIKGMEMPKSCEACPCKTADAFGGLGCQATGYIPLRKANQDRPDWCPLVLVPDHGRLIDADGEVGVNVTMMPGGKCRVDLIAPTVIPATDKDTNVPNKEEVE